MLDWLSRLGPRDPVPLVLYTRAGCGLCEEMKEEIARARVREPYSLTEVDVSRDAALEAEFGESIPVLWIAGRRAFKGRLTAPELERKFARLAHEYRRAQELARGMAAPPRN